ncbi:uncharacterized protein PFL1_03925 [Pseudozyma flocculosa PF-1]|uniref:Uncharacterized protein n=1 Tax=Pseudozyma flocculosa PF-1 TaxID=1277687 RepID=A0A061H6W3_9BASI|nr:uncharacterized protein PFL1_03925 [Pseudozyma flocculosa PF-1]EPQ28622.1 hypothetical protein PFL1_03925 [Pseudozyma flocculosa PF-1]
MNALSGMLGVDLRGQVARAVDRDPLFDNSKVSLSPSGKVPYTPQNTYADPDGDRDSYRQNTKSLTHMQKHVVYFDGDCDGVIWPHDTYLGFYRLGYGFLLSLLAVFVIHSSFSYPTLPHTGRRLVDWLPDPFFRVWIANIQRCKHGSDTESYDRRGHFQPQKYEAILEDYSSKHSKDSLCFTDAMVMLSERRNLMDFFGIFAFMFEWVATYLLLWPKDGYMDKEDMLGVLDGSIFPVIAHRRRQGKKVGAFASE